MQIAIADILCQAKYAELMQERPHTGSTMVRAFHAPFLHEWRLLLWRTRHKPLGLTGQTCTILILICSLLQVSYVWGLFQLGSLTASLFVGPIADAFDPQIIFW